LIPNTLNQEEFAGISGIATRTLQRIEKGEKANIDTLRAIAFTRRQRLLKEGCSAHFARHRHRVIAAMMQKKFDHGKRFSFELSLSG
jgi:predicted transcriptional regulator